jgi:hypothetical protein
VEFFSRCLGLLVWLALFVCCSTILPALPWIQASQLGSALPSSCAQLAQQAAAAAVELSQLCALLPAVQGTLSAPAAAAAQQARARLGEAAAEAAAWGAPAQQEQQQPVTAVEAAIVLQPEDQALLEEVAGLLLHSGGSKLSSQHKGLAGAKAHAAAGKPAAAGGAQAAVLRLQQRLHVLSLKQGVLNDQLAFLAKCSAAQAKLMTRLATGVLQALTEAVGGCKAPTRLPLNVPSLCAVETTVCVTISTRRSASYFVYVLAR